MNSSGIIMLLIIAGIGFIWYLLYESRERTAKKNEGKDEFHILLETTEVPEEDKDKYLDVVESTVSEEENMNEIPMTPDETINNNSNNNSDVVVGEIETPQPTPKNKKTRKSNKK